MATESLDVKKLFEKWIIDADVKLNEIDLVNEIKQYLVSQHPEICGKCTPCRDGVVKMEKLLDKYAKGKATLENLQEFEKLVYNLRASRCSVGLDIGKNLEVVLENNYNVLYRPVKKY
ncbi:MAG: hypothetical protein JXR62_00900 [Bacilli bacterium]|nr:hypothetical protein [Bacilli bacterium]